MEFVLRAQTSWVCCNGSRVLCKHGRKKKEKTCYVREEWISFDKEAINKTFKLKEIKDGSKFKRLQKELEYKRIVELLTNGKGEWKYTKKNPFESIARGSLTEKAKVWFYFLASILLPSKHQSTV